MPMCAFERSEKGMKFNMEKEKLESLIEKYKLPKEEHEVILENLKRKIFSNSRSTKAPSVMFVIGQPGCGKTTFINSLDLSNYIIINSDEYRHLSKYSDEILKKYPTYYSKLTNYDAHLWGDELFSYAVNNGYSVLREKAPVDYSLIDLIKSLKRNQELSINVVVVNVGNLTSLIATRERYEKELLDGNNNAKLSNIEAHNKCYDILPDFIGKCIQLGVCVRYAEQINNGFKTQSVGHDYLRLLEKIRSESNIKTCLNFENRLDDIKQSMRKRNASPQQFDEIDKIEDIYAEIMNSQTEQPKNKGEEK